MSLLARRAASSATASCSSRTVAVPLLSRRSIIVKAAPKEPIERDQGVDPKPKTGAGTPSPFGKMENPPAADGLPDTPDTRALKDTMSWYGSAPETINSRLAMVGFTAALGAELASGTPLWEQIVGARWPVIGIIGLFIVASLVPIGRGANLEAGWGPFKKDTELINGRAAMIGLVALAITELVRGGALFNPAGTALEEPVKEAKESFERFDNNVAGGAVVKAAKSFKSENAPNTREP